MRKARGPMPKQASGVMKSKIMFSSTTKKSPQGGVKGLVDNVPVMKATLPKRGLGKVGKIKSKDVIQTGPRVNMETSSHDFDQFVPFSVFEVLQWYS